MKIQARDIIAPIVWLLSIVAIFGYLRTFDQFAAGEYQHKVGADCAICHLEDDGR
jgi:hypothetical protein